MIMKGYVQWSLVMDQKEFHCQQYLTLATCLAGQCLFTV